MSLTFLSAMASFGQKLTAAQVSPERENYNPT